MKHFFIDCGVGAERVFARDLAEAHALCCLYAGIDFAGNILILFFIQCHEKLNFA